MCGKPGKGRHGTSHYAKVERGLYCNHLVCPSVRPFVRPLTLSLKMSQLLLEEMILFLIHDFGIVTVFMFAVMKTFVTDISVSTGRNDFIFDIWLWHGDLYHVSP
jgi:hypothetical protein